MISTQVPFSQYFDKSGDPLDNGFVYFGVENQNPETSPLQAYWDFEGTQPVAQPVRTLGGYLVRSGSPANVFVDAAYSTTVKNRKGELVYYSPSSSAVSNQASDGVVVDSIIGAGTSGRVNEGASFFALGRSAPGDGGGGWCRHLPDSSVTADGGLVFTVSGLSGRVVRTEWSAIGANVVAPVEWFGAVADADYITGAGTDSYAAFAAALSSPWTRIVKAVGMYYSSQGLVVNGQRALIGALDINNQDILSGSVINFASGVAKCVQLTSGANATAGLENITIKRVGGMPGAETIGVEVFEAAMTVMRGVNSVNHGHLYSFESHDVSGISAEMLSCHGGRAVTSYFRCNNWPELKVNGGRYGVPGNNNYDAYTFFLFTGDDTSGSTGVGPNTIVLTGGVNMNQGIDGPQHFATWDDIYPPQGNQASFLFEGAHIEGVTDAVFKTNPQVSPNPNTPFFYRVAMNNTTLNCPPAKMFDFASDTIISEVIITNSFCFVTDVVVTPAARIDNFIMSNNLFNGRLNIAPGGLNSVGLLSNNLYVQGIDIGGNWARLQVTGADIQANLGNTTTGNVIISEPNRNALKTFTALLAFGGTRVAMDQPIGSGIYQVNNDVVTAMFYITLTNKGTSTGNAAIYGNIPAPSLDNYIFGNSGVCHYVFNMSGLTSPITGQAAYDGAAPIINLSNHGATGASGLTHANFTNTSILAGTVTYIAKRF